MTFPNTGAPEWGAAQASPWATVNEAGYIWDAFASRSIIEDRDLTAPPGACANGARYLIAATATGVWATHDGELAIALGTNASNGWYYADVASEGTQLFVRDESLLIEYDGAAWVTAPGGVSIMNDLTDVIAATPASGDILRYNGSEYVNVKLTETLLIAVGDETTAITTGVAKVTFRMPYAFTVTAVRASLTTVSSSGIPTVDINEAGVSILSTKLTIDASEKTSTTAATAAVISDASLADDAEMTIDIDVAGTGAAGLKVYIIGYRT